MTRYSASRAGVLIIIVIIARETLSRERHRYARNGVTGNRLSSHQATLLSANALLVIERDLLTTLLIAPLTFILRASVARQTLLDGSTLVG